MQPNEPWNVERMLEERETRYGSFINHALITQELKTVMRRTPNWPKLSYAKKECLEMVAHKIGRILNGDPMYKDSWDDIIGYVTLITNDVNEVQK